MRGLRGAGFAMALLFVCTACETPGSSPFFEATSPVRVLDTTPPGSAPGVAVDATIEIELSGEVLESSLGGAVTVAPIGGAVLPVQVTADGTIVEVRLAAGATFDLATTYRVTVSGLRDLRSRPIEVESWTFQTVAPPEGLLVTRLPAPGTTAPGDFLVRAVFNVALDPAQVGPNAMRLNGGGIGGTVVYDAPAQALTFRPNSTVDGPVTVNMGTITDVYGRDIVPPDWSFTADAAIEDVDRPVLPGQVSVTETSAGTIAVTFEPATDDVWGASDMRYEALFLKLPPASSADCEDAFSTESLRVVGFGDGGTLLATGLSGGRWSVFVEAEDGSGRRSLPRSGELAAPLSIGVPTFGTHIQPILEQRCALAGCHAGSNPPGFVDYTAPREEIVAHVGQLEMPLVEPFCLESSYLWRKLMPGFEIVGQHMAPPGVDEGAISRRERDLFRRWIVDQGGQ